MKKENSTKPSEEMRWTQFYAEGYDQILAKTFPRETLWKFIERGILEDNDRHDALVYFGRHIRRSQFIEQVHLWGRVLKGMGLKPGDEMLIFCPTIPESIYVLLAANMVGVVAVLPNLSASPQALAECMSQCQVAFVYDGLEHLIAEPLSRNQFRHVVLMDVTRSMAMPLRMVAGTLNWLKTRKVRHRQTKYMSMDEAVSRFGHYEGELEAPNVEGQTVMVFSSGGTTVQGKAKQIGMSNEAMINMFRCALAFNLTGNPFREGTIAYCPLPLFVCTGFFVLVLAPLFRGMTTHLDPRLNQKQFTKSIMSIRPQITLVPGRFWQGFFHYVEELKAKGKRPDLSFFRFPIMGGEGCTPEALKHINDLMRDCGSPIALTSGYGLSETFSVATVDYQLNKYDKVYSKRAISVGYPFPGVRVGIFDEQGNELGYGQRGEIRILTPALTSGYLNNDELTRKLIHDGWVHSGDYGEMDEDGLVYVYGRMEYHVVGKDGTKAYLFDIANELRQDAAIKESVVCSIKGDFEHPHIVAHLLVHDENEETEKEIICRLDKHMTEWLPEGVRIEGYMLHHGLFEVSIVGKVDRNLYRKIMTGYRIPRDGQLLEVSFSNN